MCGAYVRKAGTDQRRKECRAAKWWCGVTGLSLTQKPVAFIAWVAVSDAVKESCLSGSCVLYPADRRSGGNIVIVESIFLIAIRPEIEKQFWGRPPARAE